MNFPFYQKKKKMEKRRQVINFVVYIRLHLSRKVTFTDFRYDTFSPREKNVYGYFPPFCKIIFFLILFLEHMCTDLAHPITIKATTDVFFTFSSAMFPRSYLFSTQNWSERFWRTLLYIVFFSLGNCFATI